MKYAVNLLEKMINKLPCITIKPSANRHRLFLTFTGILTLIFFISIGNYFWQQARLILIFGIMVGIVTCILGLFKLFEPKVSFLITPKSITHLHKYGQWELDWQSIKSIGLVKETFGIETEELPYVALSLTSLNTLAQHITPRLASRLIHEQNALLIYCLSRQLITSEQSGINFEPFTLSDGRLAKGPVAAFLHQSQLLQQALGYHLFIHAGSIDRSTEDFCQLLRQCKANAAIRQAQQTA